MGDFISKEMGELYLKKPIIYYVHLCTSTASSIRKIILCDSYPLTWSNKLLFNK